MNKASTLSSTQKRKALNQKIAEIIWIAIGAIVIAAGFLSCILGTLISNMNGNFERHSFYPIYKFEIDFFEWLNKWSKINLKSFLVLGFYLIVFSMVYLLIVLYIYATKKDAQDKKDKARKLRERNLKRFEDERKQVEEQAKLLEQAKETDSSIALEPVGEINAVNQQVVNNENVENKPSEEK